ncbi:uncharacterized protein MYCFIDRAFT_207237 [Pseudocercospora fijiensis CIRAD86]|uniref:Uncharacterized protein n=1 Tax=Pseudocercospora fijiensis (strain CIRAD86) TaxID=383855 RepID=M3AIA3_PSEFD|nr:uncharacterized protein MYCFIDRAFT_207237 [Pseudocercospora fijiensis CIRAD86]EME84311.1 hypothetical protein MYCFIDRAFT_207237 [Pseudocercospora fijiensis CIRAD86]
MMPLAWCLVSGVWYRQPALVSLSPPHSWLEVPLLSPLRILCKHGIPNVVQFTQNSLLGAADAARICSKVRCTHSIILIRIRFFKQYESNFTNCSSSSRAQKRLHTPKTSTMRRIERWNEIWPNSRDGTIMVDGLAHDVNLAAISLNRTVQDIASTGIFVALLRLRKKIPGVAPILETTESRKPPRTAGEADHACIELFEVVIYNSGVGRYCSVLERGCRLMPIKKSRTDDDQSHAGNQLAWLS